MKASDTATIYPKEPTLHLKPISINYSEGREAKVKRFFINLVRTARNENPPRYYKAIIYIRINNELKYLMPFEF